MALGRQDLEEVRSTCNELKEQMPILEDCWDTFQYVFKRDDIENWSQNTNIGAETKAEIIKHCDYLNDVLFPNLRQYFESVEAFVERQENANNGGSI